MKIEEDRLKQLYQAYVTSTISKNRKGCPSPKVLLKIILSSASYGKKKKLIDHISRCPSCKDEFCFLIKLNNSEAYYPFNKYGTFRKSYLLLDPFSPFPLRSRFIKYSSILVSLVLIITSFILIQKKETFLSGQRRNNQLIQLINPCTVHILPNPLIFKWEEYPEAQYYILELFDNTLLPLWASPRLAKSEFLLPEEILATLKTNSYYFWMTSAFNRSEKIAESDLASFFTKNK